VASVIPAAAVFSLVVFMSVRNGGFAPTVRYPVSLFVLALLLTVVIASRDRIAGLPRPARLVLLLFGAFTAWQFASITWAEAKDDAWDGANRTLLYLLVLVLLASWPITVRAGWILAFAFTCGVAVVGLVTVEQLIRTNDVSSMTIGNRLSSPLGYPNATAALFMVGLWLAIGLASRSWLHPAVRGMSFGLAVLLAGFNLLGESRGSVFTLPLVVAAYLALVSGRLRSILTMALVAGAFAPAFHPLLEVYRSTTYSGLQSAARHGLATLLTASVALALIGTAVALVDRRVVLGPRVKRAATIGVVCLVVAGPAVALASTHPVAHARTAWHEFRHSGEPGGTTRFGGLGSNRFDFWRVGLDEFTGSPIVGIGADNFLVPYLVRRRSGEEPLYPHSLWVDLLSQSGLVGTALFVAFLGTAVVAMRRSPHGPERELSGVVLVGTAVVVFHALVDWLWEIPALGTTAVALLGLALALGHTPRPRARLPRRLLIPAFTVTAVVVSCAAVSFALPWLAAREEAQAVAVWPRSPDLAFAELRKAHALDPLSDRADVLAGAIASKLGRYELMRTKYEQAVDREPYDWYAQLELGVAAAATGRTAQAGEALQRSRALNPRDPIVRKVVALFAAGRRIDPSDVDRMFLEAVD